MQLAPGSIRVSRQVQRVRRMTLFGGCSQALDVAVFAQCCEDLGGALLCALPRGSPGVPPCRDKQVRGRRQADNCPAGAEQLDSAALHGGKLNMGSQRCQLTVAEYSLFTVAM